MAILLDLRQDLHLLSYVAILQIALEVLQVVGRDEDSDVLRFVVAEKQITACTCLLDLEDRPLHSDDLIYMISRLLVRDGGILRLCVSRADHKAGDENQEKTPDDPVARDRFSFLSSSSPTIYWARLGSQTVEIWRVY